MRSQIAFATLIGSLGLAAGCSPEPPDTASSAGSATAYATQPPHGVPAGTFPLPLPEPGRAYNNPQPRDNIRDGGVFTLPVGELGPNFNRLSVDGNTVDLNSIMDWISPVLWHYSVTGEASPNPDFLLSAEVVADSPETIKYTLNPNAKWNDGTPIDWTAFETTWKTQRGDDPRFNPASTDGYRSIGSVTKGERNNEVLVTFKEPSYPYEMVFDSLAHPNNADPDFYRTGWINNLNPALLAGPFAVESLSPDRLVLVRNPNWWGNPPKLDSVIYRQMEDLATVNAFQNGEVDTTTVSGGRATADLLAQIRNMRGAQIRRSFNTSTSVYTLGQDSELFRNPAARQAFVLGTDRRLLVEIRYQGMSWEEQSPGSALIYPWQDGYRNNIADLGYDPEQAKTLLDAAGWTVDQDGYRYKDGKIAEFNYVTFGDEPVFTAMARAQQQMARSIGLKMNIDTRKSSDFSKTLTEGTFDVVAMGWAASSPYGYAFACQIYCSDSESNFSRVGNAHVDELLKGVGRIADPVEALRVFNDAEREALQLFGLFPIYNGPSQFVVKQGLANFGPAGFLVVPPQDVGWQK